VEIPFYKKTAWLLQPCNMPIEKAFPARKKQHGVIAMLFATN
jgi:hypothetical protein